MKDDFRNVDLKGLYLFVNNIKLQIVCNFQRKLNEYQPSTH